MGKPPEVQGSEEGAEARGVVPASDADRLRRVFLAVLALGGVVLVGTMLRPFLPAILTSLVVVALAWPAYHPFREWVRRPALAAIVGTAVLFLMVLLPVLGISLILFHQARIGIDLVAAAASQALEPGGRAYLWIDYLAHRIGMDPAEVTANLTDQAREVAGTLATRTLGLFSGLGGWFLQTLTALFTIYYLLRDGDALAEKFKDAIPMERTLTERLMSRAAEVSFAAVFGSLLVAVVQGILGGVAFWALGLPAPALWGLIMGLLSLLPVIGPFLVWMPASIILLVAGSPWKALALLVLGLAVISSVDNVLRAVFVGNRAQLHPLVVFFSVLGGLVVFGGVGIFVGPVLFVTALTLMEMARLTLDPPDGESPGTAILP
ncbi:MAG: AI-2E family transporter [Gemmatimonadales bacterium]|nr:MAG: AI-2E family transporter [Gemmatimonadales bacterium]